MHVAIRAMWWSTPVLLACMGCGAPAAPTEAEAEKAELSRPTLGKAGAVLDRWLSDEAQWSWGDVDQDDLDAVRAGLNQAYSAGVDGYEITRLDLVANTGRQVEYCLVRRTVEGVVGYWGGDIRLRGGSVTGGSSNQIGFETQPFHDIEDPSPTLVPRTCRD